MKFEMIALDTTCIEVEWLKDLLIDIPLMANPLAPISIMCNCKSAIDKCMQANVDMKMKRHLKVRHNSIRDKMKQQMIVLNFVKSKKNLANIFTKDLSRTVVLEASRVMRLSS